MSRLWQYTVHSGLRLFFKLLYHQMAWSYDAVAAIVSLGRWKAWVLSVLPELTGPRILELGYGPGHLQAAVISQGKFSVGIDASAQMSLQAYRRLRRGGLTPQLIQGLGQSLPFPNDSYDQVVATFPTEYITHSDTLQDIFRVLKPGGEFILLPAVWMTRRKPLERLAGWLFRVTGQAPPERPADDVSSPCPRPAVPPPPPETFIQPLQLAGFITSYEIRQQESGLLLILRGKKPDEDMAQKSLLNQGTWDKI